MSDLQNLDNNVWDRLFHLLYACDETVTDAEVAEDLQRAGIDTRRILTRIEAMIEERKARARFAEARAIRAGLSVQIRDIVAPKVQNMRAGARALIEKIFTGQEQLVHFNKLESAATEHDVQSLLDDLTKLAALRQALGKNERTPE
jgi:hypothetical protein